MSDLWASVRNNDQSMFKTMQAKVGDKTCDAKTGDIEEFLSQCHLLSRAPVGADPKVAAFIRNAEKTIAESCRSFLNSAKLDDHAHCLRLLARRSSDKPRTRVFTTNYDLCIEKAAAQSGVVIVDGFGRESTPTFDGSNFDIDFVRRRVESKSPEYLDGVIHLVKLHGSVDWTEQNGQIIKRDPAESPIIIYPRSDKYELSYRQPFLEMISQFQTMLRQPNLGLLLIGFGFADAHLTEMLMSAIRKNLSLRIVVATLGAEDHCNQSGDAYREPFGRLHRLIEQGDSRITLIDCDFATLTRLIPDLGTETEEDRLRKLLRTMALT